MNARFFNNKIEMIMFPLHKWYLKNYKQLWNIYVLNDSKSLQMHEIPPYGYTIINHGFTVVSHDLPRTTQWFSASYNHGNIRN